MQHSSRVAGLTLVVLCMAGSLLAPSAASSQALPHLRTTFVPRLLPEPNSCYHFSCFDRASYDGSTLAALGTLAPAVHVYRRLSSGPWYAQAVLQNRSTLPAGYDTAGYRYPIAVIGDDILVTAFQSGPAMPGTCETHVFGRTDTRWHVKQVINLCAGQFAKDGRRLLFDTGAQLIIYARGSNGLFSEESRVTPPSDGFFNTGKSLALHGWTVVVGKPDVNSQIGAAYIFQRRNGQWSLQETLLPEDTGANTRFGQSVGVYEYNVAISAPGAITSSGIGSGVVYMYTGVNENWALSQAITEPAGIENNTFGTVLTLRGRRLVVSSVDAYPFFEPPYSYLFERGLRESSWVARASLAADGLSIELSGNTAMIDRRGQRGGTFPTIINLPALREPDVAP